MVTVLNTELFEKNKKAITNLERQRAEQLGGSLQQITDAKTLDCMSKTCSALWGTGEDLYVASQERNLAMVNTLVGNLVDENTSELVKALAIWSGLKITYQREGSHVSFRFQQPDGASKELRIPAAAGRTDE